MTRARVILVVLLALQAALLAFVPSHPLGGDEPYYVEKARYFAEHGTFPRATPGHLAAVRGEGGNTDWRPPGYPLFVAAVSLGGFETNALRARVTAVQFLLIAIAVWLAFVSLERRALSASEGGLRARHSQEIAAVVLGIAPWPYAHASLISPESLNAALVLFGLLLLERRKIVGGSLLLSCTFLLRPEMLAVVPFPIAAAILPRWRFRDAGRAAACFLLLLGAQYAYRAHFTGQLSLSPFGPLRIYNEGAFAWANSWIGTEHEAYDFVYGLGEGDTTGALPARAFADDEERRAVEALRARVRREGLTREIDQQFGELARRRKEEHPFAAVVAPRLWHTAHLWLNTETSEQLLHALSYIPRAVRLPLLGALLLLKLALLAAFFLGVRNRPVLATFVIARTLLIGLVLNWMVNRYMVAAWLPLIVCALTLLLPTERATGDSRLAFPLSPHGGKRVARSAG